MTFQEGANRFNLTFLPGDPLSMEILREMNIYR